MLEKINHIISEVLLEPRYRLLRHLLVQVAVLLITVNVLWDEPDHIQPGRLGAWLAYFLQINIVIYVNMYLLVPRLLLRGKTPWYIFVLILLIICTVISIGLLQENYTTDPAHTQVVNDIQTDDHIPTDTLIDTHSSIGGNALLILQPISSLAAFLVFIAGLTTIHLFKYRLGNIRKINELTNATMAIELANLQNQINPHFLFNTLNNANILAGKDAEKSSYILQKLNDLLRYQTAGESKGIVKLTDDINFLTDYLNLEKTRRDRFDYIIHSEGDCNVSVPPLLFIPFVENAIKHNPENDSYVSIVFRVTSHKLHFECQNPKARLATQSGASPQSELSSPPKQGGLGLKNIRKRLDLLFGKNYTLDLHNEKENYTVIMEFKI
ncbi:MAG: histidine kinase [Bacteroides sp.]|nr:histidine kinase [Bacteroides sp.]